MKPIRATLFVTLSSLCFLLPSLQADPVSPPAADAGMSEARKTEMLKKMREAVGSIAFQYGGQSEKFGFIFTNDKETGAALQAALASASESFPIQQQLAALKSQVADAEKHLAEARSALAQLQAEQAKTEAVAATRRAEVEKAQAELENKAQERRAAMEREVVALEARLTPMRGAYEQLTRVFATLDAGGFASPASTPPSALSYHPVPKPAQVPAAVSPPPVSASPVPKPSSKPLVLGNVQKTPPQRGLPAEAPAPGVPVTSDKSAPPSSEPDPKADSKPTGETGAPISSVTVPPKAEPAVKETMPPKVVVAATTPKVVVGAGPQVTSPAPTPPPAFTNRIVSVGPPPKTREGANAALPKPPSGQVPPAVGNAIKRINPPQVVVVSTDDEEGENPDPEPRSQVVTPPTRKP